MSLIVSLINLPLLFREYFVFYPNLPVLFGTGLVFWELLRLFITPSAMARGGPAVRFVTACACWVEAWYRDCVLDRASATLPAQLRSPDESLTP